MSQLYEILSEKIASAENLLKKVDNIPDGTKSINLRGWIKYDSKFTRPITIEAENWETETAEALIILFGEHARQIVAFKNLCGNKQTFFNFRESLHDELQKCIAYLQTLIKADEMKKQLHGNNIKEGLEKSPMIFISHSSNDKEFVDALINLLEALGLDHNNVFCSSVPGYNIGLGKDIFETLRGLFDEHELYVMFILSPRYYESPTTLNEMGAAWVLRTEVCPFLTKDMYYNDMKGVIDKNIASLKVDDKDAKFRLNELKDKLIELFKLPPIDETKWERKRDLFLEYVNDNDQGDKRE